MEIAIFPRPVFRRQNSSFTSAGGRNQHRLFCHRRQLSIRQRDGDGSAFHIDMGGPLSVAAAGMAATSER
jgi:hypothetical protein